MLKYHKLGVAVRSQIWEYMLHRVHTSKGRALITHKEIGRLAATEFNGRQVGLLCSTSALPLINFLLDHERGHHSLHSSYQGKDSGGLFPYPTGCQGERELHPRIQRYKHC